MPEFDIVNKVDLQEIDPGKAGHGGSSFYGDAAVRAVVSIGRQGSIEDARRRANRPQGAASVLAADRMPD